MKYKLIYLIISLIFIIPGTFSLIKNGFKLSIDFTGGSAFVWESNDLDADAITQELENAGIAPKSIKQIDGKWYIKTLPIEQDQYKIAFENLSQRLDIREQEFSTVGPSLGNELVSKTVWSIVLAATLIMIYVAYRFKNFKFGITAILAMLHDTLILLGVFSLLGHYLGVEIDTLFVTAVLTILSFSVHDTIVVYDRIREIKKHHGHLDFEEIINRAVVETLGRSINNSMTIIFMLLAMYLLGGDTTKWFIFALLVGTISGTYSSTFTAAPLLVAWDKLTKTKK